jgi:hypothetical protein
MRAQGLMADLVEVPPQENQYTAIKGRLLTPHQMTPYQWADTLFVLPALVSRKSSDLMPAMLEICPRGEEEIKLFACLFLQRLLREIRVLLAKEDQKDLKALAEEADKIISLYYGLMSLLCNKRDVHSIKNYIVLIIITFYIGTFSYSSCQIIIYTERYNIIDLVRQRFLNFKMIRKKAMTFYVGTLFM